MKMNSGDLGGLSNSTQAASYSSSDTYSSETEVEEIHTTMTNYGRLLDSSVCLTNTVEVGNHTKTNVGGPCQTSLLNVSDGMCKRKYISESDSLSENDQNNPPKTKHIKPSANIKLACPFFKRDPTRFTSRQACSGPGFSSISRVKEHLYRVHKQLDYQCIRCYSTFISKDLLEEHQRAEEPCKVSVNNFCNGINETQCIALRKKPSGQPTAAQQWDAIYRILFPKASNIPSCYYESQDPTASAMKAYSQGLKQVENALMAGVQRDLDDCFDEVSQDIKTRFFFMVKERLERIIQDYQDKNEVFDSPIFPAPEFRDLEQPSLNFSLDMNFDFPSLDQPNYGSQYRPSHDVMFFYNNSPDTSTLPSPFSTLPIRQSEVPGLY